jgi:hypothetical protein
MLKHFEIQLRRSLPVAVRRLDRLLLLLLLTLGLAGCYTTFRPPESLVQPTPPVAYDSTKAPQPAQQPAPERDPYGYYPQNQFGWDSQWNWGYPSWGSFYPYSYYQNSPWGSYYYQPWWGNSYNNPYYPYYPSPGPGSPGEPQEKRSVTPRGNSTNPPPPPPPQNQGYSPPPSQNQGQGQQNPPNNDDNKKRDTDKRGRRS